jgi:flagellar biosynthetic protein FliR
MESFLVQFAKVFPEISNALNGGLMVLARMLGLFMLAPVFARKEVPSFIRISFATILTITTTMIIHTPAMPAQTPVILCLCLNFLFGLLIGFVANCILAAIVAGGDMINMQMGLSSATVLDPSTKQQNSLMGNYFAFLGIIIFISAGGVYWVFNAFLRSFEIFPIYSTSFDLARVVNFEYISMLTSNVLFMGMQIAAPVLLATLGQDIILGIISKTAPQVNVFQLSFLFKPCLGAAVMVWILPMVVNAINDYFNTYANIF